MHVNWETLQSNVTDLFRKTNTKRAGTQLWGRIGRILTFPRISNAVGA